jgi:S-disulfanyl-L-cysteine oxidoreductase SoxD
MMRRFMGIAAVTFAIGCGGAEVPAGGGAAAGGDQTARGAKLFTTYCSGCHGDKGEGSANAPAVIGKAALPLDPPAGGKGRKTQLKTAGDVFAYVKATMPPAKPGSLTDDQYYAAVAFMLKEGGIAVGDKRLDSGSAASVPLR